LRIALGLAYSGTEFCGWQSQPNGYGIQDALELAIASIAQHQIRVHAAGRTDAGVHALCQVVHFDTTSIRPINAWVRGVNTYLPDTVRVEWANEVDDDFHARFSAFERSYQYLLYCSPVASALMSKKSGWFHLPLDCDAMSEAASYLIGKHDFSGFRASECQAKTATRNMTKSKVTAIGKYFVFEFTANAFLQHQVRNMLGALVYIGKGAHPPIYMKELLQKRDRSLSPPTFSPAGLYLTGVGYESKWRLPINQADLQYDVQRGIQIFI
jgi:tRNA pseudouridine38-40 synthase